MTTRTDLDRAEAIIANVSETVEELRPWTNLPDEAHSAGSRRLIASQVTSLSNQLEELVGELRPLKSNLETDFQREKNDRLAAVESRERALDDQEEKLRQQQEELQQLQTRSTVASERKDLEKGETQLTRGQGALSESKAALVEQQTKLKRDRSQLAADRAVVAEREKKLAAGKEKLRTAKAAHSAEQKSLEEGRIGLAADINAKNQAMTKLDNDKTFWADMLVTYHQGIAQVEAGRALNNKEKKDHEKTAADHEKSVADHAKMVENFNAQAARAEKENDDTRRRLDQQSKNIKDMCQKKEADVANREKRVGTREVDVYAREKTVGTREVDVSAREKACTSKEESVKALEGYFDTQAALATQAQKQHSQQMSTLEKDLQRRLDEVRAQDAERTRRETEFRQRESTLNSSDTDPKSAGIDQAKLAEITESLSRLELNLSTCMDGNLVQLEARLGGRIGEVSATAGQLSTTANTLRDKMTAVESRLTDIDDRVGTASSELSKAVEDSAEEIKDVLKTRLNDLDREVGQAVGTISSVTDKLEAIDAAVASLKQDEQSETLNTLEQHSNQTITAIEELNKTVTAFSSRLTSSLAKRGSDNSSSRSEQEAKRLKMASGRSTGAGGSPGSDQQNLTGPASSGQSRLTSPTTTRSQRSRQHDLTSRHQVAKVAKVA
ncbi:MAG: hypothetical protein LQ338_006571 [Usnochroma carphineum]|nr:MAG: hypothetical protein LQ338_006571 [Usnochroma carphineum]